MAAAAAATAVAAVVVAVTAAAVVVTVVDVAMAAASQRRGLLNRSACVLACSQGGLRGCLVDPPKGMNFAHKVASLDSRADPRRAWRQCGNGSRFPSRAGPNLCPDRAGKTGCNPGAIRGLERALREVCRCPAMASPEYCPRPGPQVAAMPAEIGPRSGLRRRFLSLRPPASGPYQSWP